MAMLGDGCADLHPRVARFSQPRLVLRRLWSRLLAGLVAADARHRARVHLEQLDARMLRDIGVSAGDVAARAGLGLGRTRVVGGGVARPGETGRDRGGSARAGL